MTRPDDPAIGIEYRVTTDDISAQSLIPVGYEEASGYDSRTLIVDHYGDIARNDGTSVPWNESAFLDFVEQGVLQREDV